MQFGMPTLAENRTIEDNIALCSRLQLKFIELNMNFSEYQTACLEREELISAAEKAGIYFTVHFVESLDIADFNPLVSEAYLETVRRTIQAAKRMLRLRDSFGDGSQPLTLNMHMNHGVHITLPDRLVWMYARDFDAYRKAFSVFRQKCEDWIGGADLRIVIENTDGFTEYEREALESLLKSSCFGLTWDIGHSKAAGERDAPFILAHQSAPCHFHVHDGTEHPARSHLALGDGEIDLAERLRLAEQLNARCVLETKTAAALEQSVAYLREMGFSV